MKFSKIQGFEKIFTLISCVGSLIFLGFFYNNHLYRKEQLQLFELTSGYLLNAISNHGGISIWISELLIQFFHLPFAGAIILTLLVLLLQRLTRCIITKVTGKSQLILFSFIPAIGYWIILLDDFYCLSGLTGLLISLAGTLFYLNISRPWKRAIAGLVLIPALYWLTGAAYTVFVLIIVVAEIIFRIRRKEKPATVSVFILVANILLAIIIPLTAREFLFRDTILQSFISEAYYSIRIFFPLPLILIFLSFPLLIVLQNYIADNISEKQSAVTSLIAYPVLLCFAIWGAFRTADFKVEKTMAYENLAYGSKWEEIVIRAENEKPTDGVSIAAINIALAKTAQLSSKMFLFDQTKNSLFLKYLRKGMTPFIASEPFYQLGLFNFAQMFAMETIESTPDAKYPVRSFKRVAETFIINGQYDIAMKYLSPLSHTLFYRKWAKEAISLIRDEAKIGADPYWSRMRNLKSKYDFYYNPQQTDMALRYLLISNPLNKTAYEYIMAYYLLQKDFDGFLAYLPLADTLGYNKLPLVWQEAAAYIGTRLNKMPSQMGKYTIDPDIISRIGDYAREFSAGRQDTIRMNKQFGNTYWFYLHYK
jgi:hypothetical protein